METMDHWSVWQILDPKFKLEEKVLHELLCGGQTFLWDPILDSEQLSWKGSIREFWIELKLAQDSCVVFRHHGSHASANVVQELRAFFRLDDAWERLINTLPIEQDDYLKRCAERFPGLRILNQPIEEVLLTFLCSSNKRIPQIKQMLQLLRAKFGKKTSFGYRYPSWDRLSKAKVEDIAECKTGYRARYIHGSAQVISTQAGFFEDLNDSCFEEAKAQLMQLPGVGDKVAECILLYGGGFYEAFPLDTWILKALHHRYGVDTKNIKKTKGFIERHFGLKAAGLAQQYIFAYERDVKEL
jgi:N-glycosylase/DNA lyase